MKRKASAARLIFLLIFLPRELVNESVAEVLARSESNLGPDGEAKRRAAYEQQFAKSVRVIRESLGRAFAIVFGALAAALIVGWTLSALGVPSSQRIDSILEYGGIAVLLGATIGRAGWSIQTMDGNTLPESVELAVYNYLYILGSFSLALPIAW